MDTRKKVKYYLLSYDLSGLDGSFIITGEFETRDQLLKQAMLDEIDTHEISSDPEIPHPSKYSENPSDDYVKYNQSIRKRYKLYIIFSTPDYKIHAMKGIRKKVENKIRYL